MADDPTTNDDLDRRETNMSGNDIAYKVQVRFDINNKLPNPLGINEQFIGSEWTDINIDNFPMFREASRPSVHLAEEHYRLLTKPAAEALRWYLIALFDRDVGQRSKIYTRLVICDIVHSSSCTPRDICDSFVYEG